MWTVRPTMVVCTLMLRRRMPWWMFCCTNLTSSPSGTSWKILVLGCSDAILLYRLVFLPGGMSVFLESCGEADGDGGVTFDPGFGAPATVSHGGDDALSDAADAVGVGEVFSSLEDEGGADGAGGDLFVQFAGV